MCDCFCSRGKSQLNGKYLSLCLAALCGTDGQGQLIIHETKNGKVGGSVFGLSAGSTKGERSVFVLITGKSRSPRGHENKRTASLI